jgi:hypothetical protein
MTDNPMTVDESTTIDEPNVFSLCNALQKAGQSKYEVRVSVSPNFYATPKVIRRVGRVLYIELFEESKEITEFQEDVF